MVDCAINDDFGAGFRYVRKSASASWDMTLMRWKYKRVSAASSAIWIPLPLSPPRILSGRVSTR